MFQDETKAVTIVIDIRYRKKPIVTRVKFVLSKSHLNKSLFNSKLIDITNFSMEICVTVFNGDKDFSIYGKVRARKWYRLCLNKIRIIGSDKLTHGPFDRPELFSYVFMGSSWFSMIKYSICHVG